MARGLFMRLVIRLIVIATSVLLGLQTGLKAASAEESTTTPQPMQTRFVWMDEYPEYKAVFDKLDESGVGSMSIGQWPRRRFLSEIPSNVIEPVRIACTLAEILRYCPHRLGAMDVIFLAAPTLEGYSFRLMEFDEALFGRDEDCTVDLLDSPSLVTNLELVSRLPSLRKLTVYTKRRDDQFLAAVGKVKASAGVRLRDPSELARKSGLVMGTVVDSNGKPVAGATVMIYSRVGEPVVGSWTRDNGVFWEYNIRAVPYRIEAFAPPSWFAAADSKVASSEPVNAEPGDKNVRLVIDPARLAPQPPSFLTIENDDGKRIVLDPPGILEDR
jgi:hypothetical protein